MKEIIKNMSTFELGLNVTVTGIVLVFSMLVLLVLVLILFGKISVALQKAGEKKKAKEREAVLNALSSEEVQDTPVAAVVASDDGLSEELVAVISAAVASLYASSPKKPVIKAIKKSDVKRSAWANAGIADNTRAF